VKVVVAICTRNRPIMLRDCLASLFAQEVPAGVKPIALVVENNHAPDCSAQVEAANRAAPPDWRVLYTLEPELGISMARNSALETALELDPDWIAFIDDDEVAAPRWLSALLSCASRFEADVVQGPVHFVYATALPSWLKHQSPKNRRSGTKLLTAHTNNVMMRSAIARSGLRFDEAMRFSGGEDSDFFHRAADAGWFLCWADDAIVSETVGPSRLTMRWHLDRAMRVASNATVSHVKRRGLPSALLTHGSKGVRRTLRGAVIVGAGAILIPLSPTRGKPLAFRGLMDIWSGLGSLSAFLLRPPQPYAQVDGH
jgi:succinoglycan biosynthesis protein ExoM